MQGIVAGSQSAFQSWQVEAGLPTLNANEVRYGRGFLRARPEEWFRSLGSHWLPLFHTLAVDFSLGEVEISLDFPENLDRITPFEVDGEMAIVGFDSSTLETIVNAAVPGGRGAAAQVVIEYFERRLLSSLSLSWTGGAPLNCLYIPPEKTEAVEVVGVVSVSFWLQEKPCSVSFGVGPRLLDRLDSSWREIFKKQYEPRVRSANGDEREPMSVVVELAELSVPPAMLIDYVRPGTVINLGVPPTSPVTIKINGEPMARGVLAQYAGRYAVQITQIGAGAARAATGPTKLQVELARTEIEPDSIGEYLQSGAVLLTRAVVAPSASMVISGETVANAVLGLVDGQLALSVLPK